MVSCQVSVCDSSVTKFRTSNTTATAPYIVGTNDLETVIVYRKCCAGGCLFRSEFARLVDARLIVSLCLQISASSPAHSRGVYYVWINEFCWAEVPSKGHYGARRCDTRKSRIPCLRWRLRSVFLRCNANLSYALEKRAFQGSLSRIIRSVGGTLGDESADTPQYSNT